MRKRKEKRSLYGLVSPDSPYVIQRMVLADPSLIGTTQSIWLKASDDIDMFAKGYIDRSLDEGDRRVKDNAIGWYDTLDAADKVEARFNSDFFSTADSREPEEAGIRGALIGSLLTLTITLIMSFPIGVMAAVYLEEFAPKNKLTDLIEVNINNLAAVPSIVFGLLGLAMFLNFFGLPRSAPLVGGMVLALMTLPTIIIATRAALLAVPPSLREAAMGVGASPVQVVFHHVVPLACRHPDGHDHRYGPGVGRDRTPADDRHGGFHRRHSGRVHRPRNRIAGADLPLGGQPGAGLR